MNLFYLGPKKIKKKTMLSVPLLVVVVECPLF